MKHLSFITKFCLITIVSLVINACSDDYTDITDFYNEPNLALNSTFFETTIDNVGYLSIMGATDITIHSKIISVHIPYGVKVNEVPVRFSPNQEVNISLNGIPIKADSTLLLNFTEPAKLVIDEELYTVIIAYSNLPIVYLTTPNHVDITSKSEYIAGCSLIIGNTANGEEDLIISEAANLKGRGNSTWNYEKKPYAIKFDKKQSVLGLPKDKSWVLLANYIDRTLIRNAVAFAIAQKTPSLSWTPNGRFVDVVLNGKFRLTCKTLCLAKYKR